MKFYNKIIIISFILYYCIGCGFRYYLTEEDRSYNPYRKGDKLIFKSSTHIKNTLVIQNVDNSSFSEEFGLIYDNETLFVNFKTVYEDYFQYDFLKIHAATPKSGASISFNIFLGDSSHYYNVFGKNGKIYTRFYFSFSGISIDSLNKLPLHHIKLKSFELNDVIIIESNEKMWSHREHFASKIYWSKSQGYVKIERKDGLYWELVEKYNIYDKK